MDNTGEKIYEQYVKLAFRLMVAELVIVTIAVVVAVFCAAEVGMSLSACLASLALGVLLGAGLDVLRGRRQPSASVSVFTRHGAAEKKSDKRREYDQERVS